MKWSLLLGWGIVIYAIVYWMWSFLVIHGYVTGFMPHVVLAATLVVVVVAATRNLHLHHWYDVLPYSIGWAFIAAFLDLLCAVPVSGWAVWSDWNIWVGYLLLIFIPLVVPVKRAHHSRHERAS